MTHGHPNSSRLAAARVESVGFHGWNALALSNGVVSLVAARAVVGAVAACTAVTPRVEWPNDVLVGDRKLAGVLAEGVVGAAPVVVVGVGINVAQPADAWPPGLQGRAVSLAELGHPVARAALLAAVLAELAARYEAFLSAVPVVS